MPSGVPVWRRCPCAVCDACVPSLPGRPEMGLASLRSVLAPGGAMVLMVYVCRQTGRQPHATRSTRTVVLKLMSVHLPVCLLACLPNPFACWTVSVCLAVRHPACCFACLLVCLPGCVFVRLLSACMPACMLPCLSACTCTFSGRLPSLGYALKLWHGLCSFLLLSSIRYGETGRTGIYDIQVYGLAWPAPMLVGVASACSRWRGQRLCSLV